MYNIIHSANSAGASDAFRPRAGGLLRGRARRRRRSRLTGAEAGGLVEGRRLVALGERRVADDRLDEVLH